MFHFHISHRKCNHRIPMHGTRPIQLLNSPHFYISAKISGPSGTKRLFHCRLVNMNQSNDGNSIGHCKKKHLRYKKIRHFRVRKSRKVTKKPSTHSASDEILVKKSTEESSSHLKFSQHSNLNTLCNTEDDDICQDELRNKRHNNNKLDSLEDLDKIQQNSMMDILKFHKFVNDKLYPETDELEFVEFINEYGEIVYLQRCPIQLENYIIQSGFLFLSSPSLHWGEILTIREAYVIDGSGSIICKDLKSNTKEDFCISKGEKFVLVPGCTVELQKDSNTMILKLFIVYL